MHTKRGYHKTAYYYTKKYRTSKTMKALITKRDTLLESLKSIEEKIIKQKNKEEQSLARLSQNMLGFDSHNIKGEV